jgi:hypothetical protein
MGRPRISHRVARAPAQEGEDAGDADVQSLTEPPAPGVTCRVTDVERYSDEV